MVFSSLYFLFLFLPVVLGLYFLAPKALKNFVLLLASVFFYAWGEPIYVILMLLSILLNYVFGLDIDRASGGERTFKFVLTLVVNLFILGFFKYYVFCAETLNAVFGMDISYRELALPIGISFYTFQALSYIIDVYRGEQTSQRSLLKFALYITMFPQLIAGPIVQYGDMAEQLNERKVTLAGFGYGMERFGIGLAKKVLLANNLGALYTTVQALDNRSVLTAWLGIAAYTMQIYFDFSGYSDMAIGLGRMFGFKFRENFNYPYIAASVTEFWRRWHISLSSWFRNYVYIPLGGNRVPRWKHVRNILAVWLLTGLWHGASWNFVLWGVYYGVLLLIEKYLFGKKWNALPGALRHICTMLLVMIGWVFFSNTDIGAALGYFGNLWGVGTVGLVDTGALYYLKSNLILLILGVLACMPGTIRRFRWIAKKAPCAAAAVNAGLFLLCVAYLVYGSYNPFLYFRF